MNQSLIIRTVFVIVLMTLVFLPVFAQQTTGHDAETSTTVPALKEFHTVIFQIWHTAWPNKDYALLTSLVPDVERGVAAIAAAELPGILREKKDAWAAGVAKLQTIAAEYKAAAEAKKQPELLAAAERLHAQYEALARTLRPPLKELEEFHAVLYMLYHYYMPQDSLANVKSSVRQLQGKMSLLEKATLPERYAGKADAFAKARTELGISVQNLAATLSSNDTATIRAAVEVMHSRYETLAGIFE
jgi:hypothetical protein